MRFKRNEDPIFEEIKRRVRQRDKYTCQMCGKKPKSYKGLNVHHIQKWADRPSLRFNSENLITLCWTCHNKIKGKEQYYISFFLNVLEENEHNS
jgi:5-methylcytosine-specific restriction endonuclease McrA